MTCEEAKEQLVLLAYDELTDAEQADLELHMHGCPPCEAEALGIRQFREEMAEETIPEVSPNLLAASRVRLDEALDSAGPGSLLIRLKDGLVRTWQHLYAAPALATLLVGVGFLSGNLLSRYQAAHLPPPPTISAPAAGPGGTIASIRSIQQTSDPDVVQVSYNQVVPYTLTASMEDPRIRQLLMQGLGRDDNDLRVVSVEMMARECLAGHRCEYASEDGQSGFRDALLVRMRYDKSATVRLKALEGLKPFVAEDLKVRDAILESLMHDTSAEIRARAITMLTPVEADASVRRVLHAVSTTDASPHIRDASMQVLGDADALQ